MSVSDLYGPQALQWADYWDSDTRYGRITDAAEKFGSEPEGIPILQIIGVILLIITGLILFVGILKLMEKNKNK